MKQLAYRIITAAGLILLITSYCALPGSGNKTYDQMKEYEPSGLISKQKEYFNRPIRLVLAGEQLWGQLKPSLRGISHTGEMYEILKNKNVVFVYDDHLKSEHSWKSSWMEPVINYLFNLCANSVIDKHRLKLVTGSSTKESGNPLKNDRNKSCETHPESLEGVTCMDSVKVSHPGLRVAMLQLDVVDGNPTENMKRAEKNIRKAVKMKAEMVCLPEAADLGWLCQQARERAFPIPGRYTDFLSRLAKEFKVWISAGCLEKDGDKTYNSAVLIDRSGRIVLKHRKINTLPDLTAHLYDAGSADSIKVVDTELGRIGITICADNFDIENPQKVADLGAWLLIAPHGFAKNESDLPNNAVSYMNHIKRVAGKTKLWVIGTDTGLSLVAGGKWKGYLHSGCSTIADPSGKVKAIGKFKETDLVIYDIPGKN